MKEVEKDCKCEGECKCEGKEGSCCGDEHGHEHAHSHSEEKDACCS